MLKEVKSDMYRENGWVATRTKSNLLQ